MCGIVWLSVCLFACLSCFEYCFFVMCVLLCVFVFFDLSVLACLFVLLYSVLRVWFVCLFVCFWLMVCTFWGVCFVGLSLFALM